MARVALIRPVPLDGEKAYIADYDGESGIRVLARWVGERGSAEFTQQLRRRRMDLSLRPHPALVALVGCQERQDGVWWLEAEPSVVPLPMLWPMVREGGPAAVAKTAWQVILSASVGLSALHGWKRSRGAPVLHGALRPSAIGVRSDGQIVLGRYAPTLDRPWADGRYASPEVRRTGRQDQASEVYALGVVLLELLGGRVDDPHQQKVEAAHTFATEILPEWSGLGRLLVTLLQTDPSLRVQQSLALLGNAIAASPGSAVGMPPVPALVPRSEHRARWTGEPPRERSLADLSFDLADDDLSDTVETYPATAQGPQNQTPDTDMGRWDVIDERLLRAANGTSEPPAETLVPPEGHPPPPPPVQTAEPLTEPTEPGMGDFDMMVPTVLTPIPAPMEEELPPAPRRHRGFVVVLVLGMVALVAYGVWLA